MNRWPIIRHSWQVFTLVAVLLAVISPPSPARAGSTPVQPGSASLTLTTTITTTCGVEPAGPAALYLPLIQKSATGSRTAARQQTLPPDPRQVATPLDQTVPTDIYEATRFLYSGDNPVQVGMTADTIDPKCVAVLRGQIIDRAGQPLSGVTVRVLNHPEFGHTLSRADGAFDLVVNGGQQLTLSFEKTDFPAAQRQVTPPWREYTTLDDVALIPYDKEVTQIDFSEPIEVARGSSITDEDGERRATLLFSQGTQARMLLPNGQQRSLANTPLSVRATEYTVGQTGDEAMPGELPANVGYTYAVELSIDEAVAAGARSVEFSQPVIFYMENFLDFPVGVTVPTGFYDRERGAWVPANNGLVVAIINLSGGQAQLDVDGDGQAEDAAALADLGITPAEQTELAGLYNAGQSLWRVPIPHFTPWDHNFPYGPPGDALAPNQTLGKDKDKEDCKGGGWSIIGCQSQTLDQAVAIPGAPFNLHYSSARSPARQATDSLTIPLSGDDLPASLKRIDLKLEVAGRAFNEEFPPNPNQAYTFTWDGLDAYDRPMQGAQPLDIEIGYVYDGVYQEPADFEQSFANFSGVPITGNRTRREVTLWQKLRSTIGTYAIPASSLGGWTLSIHHVYDANERVLYRGDGVRRNAAGLVEGISTVFGNGELGAPADGEPAIAQPLLNPYAVTAGPDGSIYVTASNVIWRVDPDGIVSRVAGLGQAGYTGDGGPALEATFVGPTGLDMGPDGSLYVADRFNEVIRRIRPDGIVETVAGTGEAGYSGDGGPAAQAQLDGPYDVAVSPDGALYISDRGNHRIRRVGLNGIITTVAGTGETANSGDGGPATTAAINTPGHIALSPQGELYLTTSGFGDLRKIGRDGLISTVARTAFIWQGQGLAIGPDGRPYISYFWGLGGYIYRVEADGSLTVIAGTGENGYSGDGGPATQARFGFPQGIDFGPDGSLYIADTGNNRIRAIGSILPGYSENGGLIASEDGRQVFRFDGSGRHLQTLDAVSGATLYDFAYNDQGLLTQITDRYGKITTIERDGDGQPTAIVGPYDQRTTLSLDNEGYLAGLEVPGGQTLGFTYTTDGLMTGMTDPADNSKTYRYDEAGRLIEAQDVAGHSLTLARVDGSNGFTVTKTTPLGHQTDFFVESNLADPSLRTRTSPAGAATELRLFDDGSRRINAPDGTEIFLVTTADPRWGGQVPLIGSLTVTTPNGLVATRLVTRSVDLVTPTDRFSLTTLTDTVAINGRRYTSIYNAATRTLNQTSPAGRESIYRFDENSRLIEYQAAPGLEPLTYSYDAQGRLIRKTHGPQVWSYNYDSLGRLIRFTNPASRTMQYDYDAANRLVQSTLPSGRSRHFVYNATNDMTTITMPDGAAHSLAYNDLSLPTGYTPPNNPAYSAAYNADRATAQKTLPGGRVITYQYDPAGRLSGLSYPEASIAYTYLGSTDRAAAITRTPNGGGISQTITYDYDGSLLTGMTFSGPAAGRYQYRYNNNFFVAGITANGQPEINLSQDADGFLTGFGPFTITRNGPAGAPSRFGDGALTIDYSYDDLGRPTGRTHTVNGQTIYQVAYTYNAAGQLQQKVETVAGAGYTNVYSYDQDGRLALVSRDGSLVEAYAYDLNGNRVSRQLENGAPETATYDSQDRLQTLGAVIYQFDVDGFLSQRGGDTFQYSATGELLAATVGGQTVSYSYDGLGRRVSRAENGETIQYLYGNPGDVFQVTATRDPQGTLTSYYYDATGNLAALERAGAWYYIATDQVGTPLVVSDAQGQPVKLLSYDSFGNLLSDSNPGFELPFGFAGGLADSLTGLVRFGYRDYDPAAGRWTARDPIFFQGGQTNLYVYVANDPINRRDPSGLFCLGASFYDIVGGGGKFCATDKGISICAEGGFGVGGAVDVDPFGDLDDDSLEGSIGVKAGPLGGELSGKWQLDECDNLTGFEPGFNVEAGPLSYDGSKLSFGPFSNDGSISGDPDDYGKNVTDLVKKNVQEAKDLVKGKLGGGLQAKASAKLCRKFLFGQ